MKAESYDDIRSHHNLNRRFEVVNDFLSRIAPKTVLEVGCGTGVLMNKLSVAFKGTKFFGIDIDKEFIQFAKKTYGGKGKEFQVDDIRNIEKKFDVIITIDVLHHLDYSIEEFAENVVKRLNKGGHWIVFDHNALNPYILLWQILAERRLFNFIKFEKTVSKDFDIQDFRKLVIIPSFIKNPSKSLMTLETKLESLLGGSRAYLYKVK